VGAAERVGRGKQKAVVERKAIWGFGMVHFSPDTLRDGCDDWGVAGYLGFGV
jgi:hypothetical protein